MHSTSLSRRRLAAALVLLGTAAWLVHGCAPRSDDGITHEIHAALEDVRHEEGSTAGLVARFYGARGDRPAWLRERRLSPDAIALRTALARLPAEGLFGWEPEVGVIDSLMNAPRSMFGGPEPSDSMLAALDLRLSTAYVSAARRLRDGAFPPAQLDKAWRGKDKHRPGPDKRLAQAVEHHAVAESLAACAPREPGYVLLRDALAGRVRAFQAAHALDTTGVADAATRKAMPDSLARLVSTVAMNLERRRWLQAAPTLPRVEVNICDATLAARADTGAVLRMRVIVGDRKHPTPVFSSAIAWMDLNPTWTLSRRVIAEEVVPGLKRNPHYFADHDMILMRPIQGKLQPVDAEGALFDSVTSDTFKTFVRQLAGEKNPLGRIRFMLPNVHAVYLHDTNQRGLFSREDRARSHGCVRLQKPLDLAAWLLSLRKPTPADSVRVAVQDTTARRWDVVPRVPVDVLYWTAWVDEHGALQTREDLYGLDRRMREALTNGHPERFELNPPMEWDVAP